ncbi:MAG: GspE/PulE family protein [Candidatus Peregrinibacteria bacterium]|nr:GspE/PulE family protein [Candidatus Peregrinibacteria bacterium]
MGNVNVSQINLEFEERAAEERAKALGFQYINLAKFPINPDVLKVVSAESSAKAELIPFDKSGRKLRVAIIEPKNLDTQDLAKKLELKGFEIEFYICSKPSFDKSFKFYGSKFLTQKKVKTRDSFQEKEDTLAARIKDFAILEKNLPTLHAETALNEIEILATKSRSTDIHIQPNENNVKLRFRVDGLLREIMTIETKTAKKLVSHIKYVSGMMSNISDIPQDGRLDFKANERTVDVRVSVIPTEFEESVVMRLLDSRAGIRSFSDLGFSDRNQVIINKALEKKEGLILVTGPTGSGKTTTLYSMLAELNDAGRKLVTLEDPIEYHLDNVTQSQINAERGYSFATGLRSLLRHDPDIILVGEIRDSETAKLALEASLTGHGVLSSIHTNSATGAISRLRNLGVENFTISPTVNAVFAQRLIRKVCPHCAKSKKFVPDKKLQKAIDSMKTIFKDLRVPESVLVEVGCEKCSFSGYSGLMAIAESFLLTDEVRNLIANDASEMEIAKFLRENQGFFSIFEDGLTKVFEQKTTLNEISRVL